MSESSYCSGDIFYVTVAFFHRNKFLYIIGNGYNRNAIFQCEPISHKYTEQNGNTQ